MSQADFARHLDISAMRVSHVVHGMRPVTAELALRLGKALGQSAEYWLNLQTAHDLAAARSEVSLKAVRRIAEHQTGSTLRNAESRGSRLSPRSGGPDRAPRRRAGG